MIRTNEQLNFTNSPRTHTALPPSTTAKKITSLDTRCPDKHWNIRKALTLRRKKRTANPKNSRQSPSALPSPARPEEPRALEAATSTIAAL
jgi:hypothetical protein